MTCFGYRRFSVQDHHAHDIKLNRFKTSVALKFMIILHDLITTNKLVRVDMTGN